MNSYKTVIREASDEFVEKRSRFIGYVKPVTTADEANAFVSAIKSKHFDAKHNVYAYILKDGSVKKYSDDGEPQGTAGMPVLEVIEKSGLCDVCVVVTRYFGGILLGGGGLFRAYTQAAKLALEAGGVAEMSLTSTLRLECDYNFYSRLQSIVANASGAVDNTDFSDKVTVDFYVLSENEENIINAVFEASNGKFRPEKLAEGYKRTNF